MTSASHTSASKPLGLADTPFTLVFDLDGTLVDSGPDLMATLNVILRREGAAELPLEAAGHLVGAGARALLERGFAQTGRVLEPGHMDGLYRDFIAYYGEHLADHTRAFPGVEASLEAFAAAGHRLAVCTNKITAHSEQLLAALDLRRFFSAVCGRDAFPVFKPDPGHLLLTIAEVGGDPARSIMIGDSKTDIATAKAAGVPSICVSFGYTDIAPRELGATLVVDDYRDMTGAVSRIAKHQAPASTTSPQDA